MKPEAEIEALKQKVAYLERQVSALLVRLMVADSSSRDVTPAGYIEIAIDGNTAKIPYFAVVS